MSENTSALMSRWDAEDWEYDEETGGLVHFSARTTRCRRAFGSRARRQDARSSSELVAHETVLVLAGTGTLQVDGGPVIELAAGDMISMRKGARTTWVVDADFKEFWVYSDPDG